MASIMDVIKSRRSIRKMKKTPISEETLNTLLEAARLAPSWANLQCWHFIVIKDEEKKHQLAEAGGPREAMINAPVILVACAYPKESGNRDNQQYYMLDIGIAVEHIVLEAEAQGLGTCWVGWFDEAGVRDILKIPDQVRVVALMPIGYPDESPEARSRKSLQEIVYWNSWEGKI